MHKGAVIGQRHAATPQIIYTKFLRRGGVQFGITDLRRGGVPLPDDWTLKHHLHLYTRIKCYVFMMDMSPGWNMSPDLGTGLIQ